MAVNGIEIKVGQVWRTKDRRRATISGVQVRGRGTYPIRGYIDGARSTNWTNTGLLVFSGTCGADLVELLIDVPNDTTQDAMRQAREMQSVKGDAEREAAKKQRESFAATDETAGHIDRASNQPFPDIKAAEAVFGKVEIRDLHTGANTTQVGGDHYKTQAIQPWDYILANGLGFLAGNVVKYVSRFDKKNGVEDLKKARHYLDKLIESEQAK